MGGDVAVCLVVGYPKVGFSDAGWPLAGVDEFGERMVQVVRCDPGHEQTPETLCTDGCACCDSRSMGPPCTCRLRWRRADWGGGAPLCGNCARPYAASGTILAICPRPRAGDQSLPPTTAAALLPGFP